MQSLLLLALYATLTSRRVMPAELTCNENDFSTIYCINPPYVFEEESGEGRNITGGIYFIVEEMVRSCCGEDMTFKLSHQAPSPRLVEENFDDSHNLAFPVSRSQLMLDLDLMVPGLTYLPVIETQGSFVLAASGIRDNIVISAIAGSWPLALVVLSTAGIAGFIMWGLDTYWNPDDFPLSFPRGPWEGTWWAFVTMTTVGYGDRAPRSIPGRIFGLIWMFTGIIIMAIFTAALVTALTAEWPIGKGDIKGFNIGVKNGSVEEHIAYLHGSKVFKYGSISQMTKALISGKDELDALLVDSLYGLYWADHLEDEGIVQASTLHHQGVHGILVQGLDEEMTGCFSKYVLRHRFRMLDFLEEKTGQIGRESHHPTDHSQDLVGDDMVIIYVMCTIWLCLIIGCVIWEYGYKKHWAKSNKQATATSKPAGTEPSPRSVSTGINELSESDYGSMEMGTRNNGRPPR